MHHPRTIEYSKELNQEQLAVVLGGDGPCLVLAGAGSGKTRTVTYRVSYLLEQGVDPSSILLLTFTNKASKEMLHRVAHLSGPAAEGIWGGTFHSLANRLLRGTAKARGVSPSFTILDQEDSQSLVKAVLKELKIDPKARRFPSAAVLQDIISFSRNTMQPVSVALEIKHPNFEPLAAEIEEVARIYAERKRLANSLDFDDLLTHWLAVINDEEIGRAMSDRFQYILVDEYQDTNALQAAIVKGLGRVHRNVLVVGDDAQSIYAFRGADVKNILRFRDEWPDAKIFKLLTNYRSVPEILDLANDSLSHNVDQYEKELIGVKTHGAKPVLVPCSSARQEAEYVTGQILKLRNEGVALANMAVLFRSSSHSQALEFECLKRDIPYEYRGGMKFFGRAHIKDVLSHLRLIENAQDEAAWLRVLNLQQGIGSTTASTVALRVTTLGTISDVLSTDVADALPSRAREGWQQFAGVLRQTFTQGPEPSAMVRALLESSYRDYLEREYPDFRERLEDLEQLARFAEGYHDLASFLADISLYDDVFGTREKEHAGDTERIVLSTIHQAKGLEWDTVFLVHLTDNGFPHRRALDDETALEEERRLFYVAVTRARNRLVLSYPITSGFDTLMFNRPSMFIEELAPRLLERIEMRESNAFRSNGCRRLDVGAHGDAPWSDDGEGVIAIRRDGERSHSSYTPAPTSKTVWKSTAQPKEPPKRSFLRDV